MAQDLLPITYKYKIKADDFVKLFLADDDKFEELKKELGVEGVERLTCNELNIKFQSDSGYATNEFNNQKIIFVSNTDIVGNLFINNIKKSNRYPLFFYKSRLAIIYVERSELKNINNENSRTFYFVDSITNNFNIDRSVLGNIEISRNSKVGDINFTNSEMESFVLYKNSLMGQFDIINSKLKQIILSKHAEIGDFNLKNSSIKKIIVEENSVIGILDISSSSFIGNIYINDSIISHLNLIKSSIGDTMVKKSSTNNFYFENCNTGDFCFMQSIIKRFYADNLCCSFLVSSSVFSILLLKNCNIPSFRLELASKLEVCIIDGQINLLNLSSTIINQNTIITIEGTIINVINMEKLTILGNLYFRRIEKAKSLIEWYHSNTEESDFLELNKLLKKRYMDFSKKLNNAFNYPTIRISQSSLGKTEFSDCPLNDFEFQFNNSNISNCFITGGTIPDDVKIVNAKGEIIETGAEMYNQKASFYNQLKRIFEAGGDIYRATQFQAKWAKQQEKYLWRKIVDNIKNIWQLNGWFLAILKILIIPIKVIAQDMFVFIFNKLSNNHGESWLKALGFTITTAILFYILYLWSIGRCFNGNEFDKTLVNGFFDFINPVNKTDLIERNYETTFWTPLWLLLGKIFVGVGTYKFLSAFRKHSKR